MDDNGFLGVGGGHHVAIGVLLADVHLLDGEASHESRLVRYPCTGWQKLAKRSSTHSSKSRHPSSVGPPPSGRRRCASSPSCCRPGRRPRPCSPTQPSACAATVISLSGRLPTRSPRSSGPSRNGAPPGWGPICELPTPSVP